MTDFLDVMHCPSFYQDGVVETGLCLVSSGKKTTQLSPIDRAQSLKLCLDKNLAMDDAQKTSHCLRVAVF
jgi:hypothetical protein